MMCFNMRENIFICLFGTRGIISLLRPLLNKGGFEAFSYIFLRLNNLLPSRIFG